MKIRVTDTTPTNGDALQYTDTLTASPLPCEPDLHDIESPVIENKNEATLEEDANVALALVNE